MTGKISESFNFADFQGLAALHRAAVHDTPAARKAVARQFESLFLNLVLSRMRSASTIDDGGLLDNQRSNFYRDLYDSQLALTLSQGGGSGLADSILRQLGPAPQEGRQPDKAPQEGEPDKVSRVSADSLAEGLESTIGVSAQSKGR